MLSSEELLKTAGEVKPRTMEKIAAIVYTLEKTNPDVATEVVDGMREVAEYTSEKLAEGYGPMARFGAGLAGGIATGLAGNMVVDLYDLAKRGLSKGRNFNDILKANPDLKKHDKAKLRQSYNTLHRYAPEFTSDPMIGGQLLDSMMAMGGNQAVLIKDLISARKSLQDTKASQFHMGPTVAYDLPSLADEKDRQERRTFETKKLEADTALKMNEQVLRAGESAARLQNERDREKRQFRRQIRLTEYKAKVDRGLEPNRPKDPYRKG